MRRREFLLTAAAGSAAFAASAESARSTANAPAWIPAAGAARAVSTANSFMSLAAGSLPGAQDRFGTIVDDFSGGVYNPHWGPLGGMLLHGGGHASTYDNSVVILDYNDLTFKRLSTSSPASTFNRGHADPLFRRDTCEYGDGQPGAGHTYDTLAVLPPADGGAAAGSLIRVSSHAVHVAISCNTAWAHRFDLAPSMSNGSWTRWSVNAPTRYRSPGACSAYDSKRRRFWWIASLSSLPPLIRYLDVASREQRDVAFGRGARPAPAAQPDSMTMRYDPVRDLLVLSVTWQGALRLACLRCDAPEQGWMEPALSSAIPARGGWSHPFDVVPEIDRLVMLAPADPMAVYEIAVGAEPYARWTVTRRPVEQGPLPVAYVAGKRWSYAPAVKSFVWLARSNGPVVAYRPYGT